jgi:predicted nucleic acid-binding protein
MLLDTSGLLCYFDVGDHRHQEAVVLFQSAENLLTHNYVLAEFIPYVNRAT